MSVRDNQKLYLMENPHHLSKIGIAVNPMKRKRQIELASGMPITIIKCWNVLDASAFEAEQYMHRLFARKRLQGEWFTDIIVSDIEYAGYELEECLHNGQPRRNNANSDDPQ